MKGLKCGITARMEDRLVDVVKANVINGYFIVIVIVI